MENNDLKSIEDVLLVGKFMGIENLFPYSNIGVYIAEDNTGYIDMVDEGIVWYHPNKDWNQLMDVCEKIVNMYFDKRSGIYQGLNECNREKTFNACVEFIKFWNDDKQEKLTWTNR